VRASSFGSAADGDDKAMKKKKIVPLIILLVFLVALIVLYAALAGYNRKKAAEASDTTSAEAQEIPVSTVSSADITAISYKTEKLSVSLSFSGGKWIITDDEKYPVDQSAVSKMLSVITSLAAARELEVSDTADFGLDIPVLTVTVTANGTEHVFTLGDVNSYNDLTYLGYNDKVYMITDTLTDVFAADKAKLFAATDSFPSAITDENVISVTVTNAKGYSTAISDADGIEDIIFDAQKYFSFAILKGYGLDPDGIAEFGINADSESIVIEYAHNNAKAVFEVMLGKDSEGKCFYTVPGSTTVYGIDATGYDKLMSYAYYTPAETTAE